MERAQRAADSPMRAILEAAKLRRRIEAEAPGEADAAVRRANAVRAAAVAEAARSEARSEPRSALATPGPVPGNGAASPLPAASAATGPAAGPPDTPVVTIRTLPNEALPAVPAHSAALAPTAVGPLRGASAPSLHAELPRPTPLPAAAGTASQPPALVHMVEPEMTPRLQELLARPEVAVEFTILPDGRVSGVQVLPPVPRALVPVIADAVAQWRFAPVPTPRPHRVQLVFRAGAN